MRRRLRILNLFLVLLLVGAGVGAVAQARAGIRPELPAAEPPDLPPSDAVAMAPLGPWSLFAAAEEHNPLDKSREAWQPPAPEEPAPPPPAPRKAIEPPSFRLTGTVIAGADSMAVLVLSGGKRDGGRTQTVRVGDTAEEYRVLAIEKGKITVEKGGERFTVEASAGQKAAETSGSTGKDAAPIKTVESQEKEKEKKAPSSAGTAKPRESAEKKPEKAKDKDKEKKSSGSQDPKVAPEGFEYVQTPMGPSLRRKGSPPEAPASGGAKPPETEGGSTPFGKGRP